MHDFTLNTYKSLLKELLDKGYSFQTMQAFIAQPQNKTVILRHDVDRRPANSLAMAQLESEMELFATYYFRTIPLTFKPKIIKEISDFGHEIGYHYENLSATNKEHRTTSKGELFELAISDFRLNLEKLRKFYPIKTICMHGNPLSKWDNRDLWNKYDYRDYGIIAEPYFDIDYNKVLYLTDTGRSWNKDLGNIRDKVISFFDLNIKSTFYLLELIKRRNLPDQIMINTHPQRWHNNALLWTHEFLIQNLKNILKRHIVNNL